MLVLRLSNISPRLIIQFNVKPILKMAMMTMVVIMAMTTRMMRRLTLVKMVQNKSNHHKMMKDPTLTLT
jgi:hypothetical protein